jgi:hypothetical protein
MGYNAAVRNSAILAGGVASILLPMLVLAQNVRDLAKEPLIVVQNGRYGYIDHNGAVVIQPQFLWGDDFDHGYAEVYVCSRLVSIDASGKVVPLRPANQFDPQPRRLGGKVGFVDASGQFKIQPSFDDALPFSDGVAAVQVHGLWGFIDSSGHEVIPPMFKAAYYFREGVVLAETDKGNVLIDKSGTVLASGYEQLKGITEEGRVPVSRNSKFGYLDLHGNVAIPLEYDDLDSFSHGLAPVKKGAKWGYIDRDGKVRIPFNFDEAGLFASGLAPARIGKETGFIDVSGKFVFQLAFEHAPGFLTGDDEGIFRADYDVSRFWTSDARFGYVNTAGKAIWGPNKETPDHPPLFGWSERDKSKSCEGISQAIRETVAGFPLQ